MDRNQEVDGVLTQVLNVQIKSLVPDPRVLNPRGPIHDTTDLQAAIKEAGRIENALWVRPAKDDDDFEIEGEYWIMDGERRWKAAQALGLTHVPVVVKDVDDDGARALILAANQHEDLPPIVLNKDGEVVGGLCALVHQAKQSKVTNQVLAAQLGESGDTVGAYNYLYEELPEVQAKVASGQLAITAYALIKRTPDELRLYVAGLRGNVSADRCRKIKKEWAAIEAKLAAQKAMAEAAEAAGEDAPVEEIEPVLPEPVMPAAFHLNQALRALGEVEGDLSPTDLFILDDIAERVQVLQGADQVIPVSTIDMND